VISARATRSLLAFTATAEGLTGLGLLAIPSVVVRLLLGAEVSGAGIVASRVAGITLLSLAAACWPTRESRVAAIAMLGYNLLVAIYLIGVGLRGELVGPLLWPVAAYHAAMVVPLGIASRRPRQPVD
jgi:hypothetical protein